MYKVIEDDLQECALSKNIILQMTIKIINHKTGFNSLISTFLVFRAYLYILEYNVLTPTITKRSAVIKNVMKKMQKVRAERQIADVLN